jgi:hypothetical protein
MRVERNGTLMHTRASEHRCTQRNETNLENAAGASATNGIQLLLWTSVLVEGFFHRREVAFSIADDDRCVMTGSNSSMAFSVLRNGCPKISDMPDHGAFKPFTPKFDQKY